MKRVGLISLFVVGCATTPEVKRMEASEYTKGSTSALASKTGGTCPRDLSKYEGEKKWKSIVGDANACVKSSQWKMVEQIGNELARREPNSPWGVYFLALNAEAQGAPERALWMVDLALKKAPDTGLLHYQKGRLLWTQGDHKASMEEMSAAVHLDPTLTEAHLFMGQVYYRDQNFDPAATHFYQVLNVRSDDSIALSGLAECRLHKGDSVGAMEILKRAISAHPQEMNFRVREAQVYESYLNQPGEALDIYTDIKRMQSRAKKPQQLSVDIEERIRSLTPVPRIPAAVAQKRDEKEKKQ